MASLPPRQTQRRPSPAQRQTSSSEGQSAALASVARSTTSLDSQTLLLNNPSNSSSQARSEEIKTESQTTSSQEPQQAVQDAKEEPRRCWICFNDETEDAPDASPWRSPCPCALTAHEQCLLDWVGDMEKPSPSRNTSAPKEILCPQCKSKIHLARPRSMVVEAVNAVERVAGKLMLPSFFTGLAYTFVIGASHHGAHTIRMIFGPEDAAAILSAQQHPGVVRQYVGEVSPYLAEHLFREWRGARLELGLPLIPLTLIASRATYFDAVLPILPIIFFATHPEHSASLTDTYWPPSAALTLVVLPYVRGIYDDVMERVWGEKERRWLRELQPRLGQDAEDREDADQDGGHHAEDHEQDDDEDIDEAEVVIEVEVPDRVANFFAIPENRENVERLAEAPRRNQAPALDAPPMDEENGPHEAEQIAAQIEMAANNHAQQEERERQQQQAPAAGRERRGREDLNLLDMATVFAEKVVGALLFPSIAAGSGEILRLFLPPNLTVPRTVGGKKMPTGLLQTRWGRSLIGGCLFVVLKDAIRIYCRYRMAQAFRLRKVLNWDKAKGKVVGQT